MPWYRTSIRGEHFRLNIAGGEQWVNFYTTQFVQADSAQAAEESALAVIRAHATLAGRVLNPKNDPPLIFVDEIEPVFDHEVPALPKGLVFFPEQED